jgi:UDP-N-acetylmuramate--alanine ligase
LNLNKTHIAYFLGIGGIGMSAIARYFKSIGIEVHGYDKTRNDFTRQLENEGFIIHYDEQVSLIPEAILKGEGIVIFTPAIPSNHQEKIHLQNLNIRLYKRAEVLGIISQQTYTIAVAGTHGKTTTSCLIAHILNQNKVNFIAFLGGISTNLNSNYIHKTDGIDFLNQPIMVVEADEYDRSFLHLKPDIAIVTSTDADHLDIYGETSEVKKSFQAFVNGIKKNGIAILNEKTELISSEKQIIYGKNEACEAYYNVVKVQNFEFTFNYHFENFTSKIINGLPGFHNVENATAAITACLKIGLDFHQTIAACHSFMGVKRRFEYVFKNKNFVVIDDYAHHPTELTSFITSVKELYPNQKITGIFQPHLFSRTRDFADDFAIALDLLDECWLLNIYPARELPIEGINSEMLALKMKKNALITSKENVIKKLNTERPEVLLIMGAGDIDQLIQPIKNIYHETNN